jgi:hypothetical protein
VLPCSRCSIAKLAVHPPHHARASYPRAERGDVWKDAREQRKERPTPAVPRPNWKPYAPKSQPRAFGKRFSDDSDADKKGLILPTKTLCGASTSVLISLLGFRQHGHCRAVNDRRSDPYLRTRCSRDRVHGQTVETQSIQVVRIVPLQHELRMPGEPAEGCRWTRTVEVKTSSPLVPPIASILPDGAMFISDS